MQLSDSDVLGVLSLAVCCIFVLEKLFSDFNKPEVLKGKWAHGKVYLYTVKPPQAWGFVPDVPCLAIQNFLDLLGIDYEVDEADFANPLQQYHVPIVEVEGQQLVDYEQIVNAICTHTHRMLPWAGYFRDCMRKKDNWRAAAVCSMILSSLSHHITRNQWHDTENQMAMFEGLGAWTGPLKPFLRYAVRRDRIQRCWAMGGYLLKTEAEFQARVQDEMCIIENLIESCSHGFVDGSTPGPHDCIVYSAVKIVLDSPLPITLVPKDSDKFPLCRAYKTRFEEWRAR
ncbi:hypothetical protein DIPPA_21936 [Diplonema papillatum]|nr:hypothetical protein DIPPA_21936 [Diplonema papillatum]